MKNLFMLTVFFMSSLTSASVDLHEFDSLQQEKRYRHLISILRCPTCQNQNLSDSNSMVSDDLKQIVYEKIRAGASDKEIILFMKQRYGEFILYQPEVSQSNVILWAGPFVFLIGFLILFFVWYNKNKGDVSDD